MPPICHGRYLCPLSLTDPFLLLLHSPTPSFLSSFFLLFWRQFISLDLSLSPPSQWRLSFLLSSVRKSLHTARNHSKASHTGPLPPHLLPMRTSILHVRLQFSALQASLLPQLSVFWAQFTETWLLKPLWLVLTMSVRTLNYNPTDCFSAFTIAHTIFLLTQSRSLFHREALLCWCFHPKINQKSVFQPHHPLTWLSLFSLIFFK